MTIEQPQQNIDINNWHVEDWKRAIQQVDTNKELSFFNDVITGKDEPSDELKKHLVLENVMLGGKRCDVYHWDQDQNGKRISGSTANRVFVHIKE